MDNLVSDQEVNDLIRSVGLRLDSEVQAVRARKDTRRISQMARKSLRRMACIKKPLELTTESRGALFEGTGKMAAISILCEPAVELCLFLEHSDRAAAGLSPMSPAEVKTWLKHMIDLGLPDMEIKSNAKRKRK